VCVVSCSLEEFCLVLFNFEVALNKIKKQVAAKKKEKEKEKKEQAKTKRGFVCVFFLFLQWCFVITFVSRLASLA
jgi:hypothetical protein